MHPQVTRKVCDKCAKEHKHACNHFDSMTQAKLEDKANNHLESDTGKKKWIVTCGGGGVGGREEE